MEILQYMYNGMYKYNILHPIIVTQAMLIISSRENQSKNRHGLKNSQETKQ